MLRHIRMVKPKTVLTTTILLLLAFGGWAQKTKKLKTKSAGNDVVFVYHVLKSDRETLHGPYLQKFKGVVMVRGQYEKGKKTGPWEFGSKYFGPVIEGAFVSEEPDGRWVYSEKEGSRCEIFYKEGKVDSLLAYYKNGNLRADLRIDDSGKGQFRRFYENGSILRIQSIEDYALNGEVKMFHSNGQVLQHLIYKNDQPYTLIETYDEIGNPIEAGTLEAGTGKLILFDISSDGSWQKTEEVTYRDSMKDGKYTAYDQDGKVYRAGQYRAGAKTREWIFYSSEGKREQDYQDEEPEDFSERRKPSRINYPITGDMGVVDKMPSFPTGIEGMMKFLGENISYPKEAKRDEVQGMTYTGFVVNKYGLIEDVEVLKSIHPTIDEEVKRVIDLMPYWSPGMHEGIPVTVFFNLPVRMTLR